MNIFSVLSFISMVSCIFLAVYVLLFNKKERAHTGLAYMCFLSAAWNFFSMILHTTDNRALYISFSKASFLVFAILIPFTIYFTLQLTKEMYRKPPFIMLGPLLGIGLMLSYINYRSFFYITDLKYTINGFIEVHDTSSFLYTIFISWYTFCVFFCLITIWIWGRKSRYKKVKRQSQIISASGLLIIIFGSYLNLYLPKTGFQNMPAVGDVCFLFWFIGVFVAIVKYRLLKMTPEIAVNEIISKVHDLVIIMDYSMNIIHANSVFEKLTGYYIKDFKDQNINSIIKISKKNLDYLLENPERTIRYELTTSSIQKLPLEIAIRGFSDKFKDPIGYVFVAMDLREKDKLQREISKRKETEKTLTYISQHDALTELYNRTKYDLEIKKLEKINPFALAIIICDVNGLKIINDTMGHHTGDDLLRSAADILIKSFENKDNLYRLGGDEFAIIISNKKLETIKNEINRIEQNINEYNQNNPDIPLSLSIGYAYKRKKPIDVEALQREADNNMYHKKLLEGPDMRKNIVNRLIEMLKQRDFAGTSHFQGKWALIEKMAWNLGVSEKHKNDLRLLAEYHDIGKVGVADDILFKPEKLTDLETLEIQRHCEIGYRIAISSPKLSHIADWILKHHEWWDGSGYPIGISGDHIPLEAQIMSIVDTYCAMTSDRPYRKAFTKEHAIETIRNLENKKFSKKIIGLFLNAVD
jgi:diguanylate cyclase (GGDEF)-like protein/PAS domain S-box-containing protein